MFSRFWSLSLIALVSNWSLLAHAHTVITYPGWRGNSLHTSGEVEDTNGLGVGLNPNGSTDDTGLIYPYGQQWSYPCGGMPTSTNRTLWPLLGGAIALQPGWFSGHATAYIYLNMGFGTLPPNMSFPMLPVFQITGPSKELYNGTFCLPQVPLPVNATVKIGDNATIQVVETAVHGAALYNCVDITFADPTDVPNVNASNCFNSSDIGFNMVFSTSSLSAAEPLFSRSSNWLSILPLAIAAVIGILT